MKIRAHETFCVRKGWIRKGVKNIILNNRLFTDKEVNPCDVLGIGANMVKSLRYWLNVVGIMEEVPNGNQKIQRLTELGRLMMIVISILRKMAQIGCCIINLLKMKILPPRGIGFSMFSK